MTGGRPPRSTGPVARVLTALIRLYRLVPRPTPRCRFMPTCSSFALEAVQVHGAARGLWLALRRIGRCHPFHPGGLDPVPPPQRATHREAVKELSA